MLPDFPELKEEIGRLIDAKLHAKIISRDPVVSQLRSFTQHEGTVQRYEQLGPERNLVEEGFQLLSTPFTTAIAEVPNLIGEKLETKLDQIAEDAGRSLARSFYDKVNESCDKAGTSVDGKAQPFSAELVLEMLSKTQTDFDENGKPTSAFVIHPDMAETAKKVAEQIENDPELKRRADEITRRQREEWSARESNRKLVD